MPNERINEGDTVQLKSGGPTMTVESVELVGVRCTWFDEKRIRNESMFNPVALKKVDPDDVGI